MSIATKTGDAGTTALMFGRRVSKCDPRVAAYGAVDELNCALGMVRAAGAEALVTDRVFEIQKELVTLMGELAVAEEDRERYRAGGYGFVTVAMVDRLMADVEDMEKNHRLTFKHWATPGATPAAAALDMARTICRRAERHIVEVHEQTQPVNPEIIRYLNRLSDVCWLWARFVETRAETAG